jgi:hypothetical protein
MRCVDPVDLAPGEIEPSSLIQSEANGILRVNHPVLRFLKRLSC